MKHQCPLLRQSRGMSILDGSGPPQLRISVWSVSETMPDGVPESGLRRWSIICLFVSALFVVALSGQ